MSITVLTAATDTRLTTLAAAKAELQVTDGKSDAYLVTLIDQASDAIRSWCKRGFAVETVRETIYPAKPDKSLMVNRWPITVVSSVTINGTAEDTGNIEIEDNGFLRRSDATGCLVFWPCGKIVVEYSAGYILPNQAGRTLPHDIERAALSLIKTIWFSRNRDPLIRTEKIEGAGEFDYFSGTVSLLPPEVESLLIPYKNVSV